MFRVYWESTTALYDCPVQPVAMRNKSYTVSVLGICSGHPAIIGCRFGRCA